MSSKKEQAKEEDVTLEFGVLDNQEDDMVAIEQKEDEPKIINTEEKVIILEKDFSEMKEQIQQLNLKVRNLEDTLKVNNINQFDLEVEKFVP